MNKLTSRPTEELTDSQLQQLLDSACHYMASLTVNSQVPVQHRKEYREYIQMVEKLERVQDERRCCIADHDSTGYIW